MTCRVENIAALPSVRIKRNRLSFIRSGQVFFAILFVLAFGFNVQGQTATTTTLISNTNNSCLNDAIILTATVDQSAAAGNVQFSEGATVLGTASLDGNGIATFTLSNLSAGNHSIIASYEGLPPFNGSVSTALDLFVNFPPAIIIQPSDKMAAIGCSASFSVNADGSGTLTYQWRKNGVDIPGANSASLLLNNIVSTDAGNYDVVVSNLCGNIISNAASLTLLPSLDVALTSQTNILCFGAATGTIDITATGGVAPYTYTWTGTGVNVNAEDQMGLIAGNYSVIVTDANDCITAALAVTIFQPSSAITINNISSDSPVCSGNTLNLFSNASGGTGTLLYSWTGPGGFTSPLQNPTIPNVTTLANGLYTLTVTDENACSATTTINVTIVQPSAASISYPAAGFCKNNSTPQLVALSGTGTFTGGTYSSFPGGLSLNSASGAFTPSTSAAGTYTVTYTKGAINVCGGITATTTVIITTIPVATFSYPGTPFCQNEVNPSPVFSGGGFAGNFTSSAGLVFINSSTGQIDLGASTPGTYTVTNTIAAVNGCSAATATSSITITAVPTATINYAGSPFCKSIAASQPVTITGTGAYTGGTYSASPSGLTLNTSTGAITPSTSVAGNYTVTYSKAASGGCTAILTTTSVTVTTPPAATITYGASQWCSGITAPQPVTRTGTSGGIYSSVPAGLGIDPVTGDITPSNSTPGTYTVRYTMSSNGCADVVATRTITINATPDVFISSDYCAGGGSVRLTANATPQPVTYLWSNGATTPNVLVDKAGTYTFTATTPQGCSATSFTNVAQELVYNGDFSLGNTGFTSAYGNNQAPYTGGSTGLWPETLYAVDSNARIHHSNFFGTDHTTGDGNFMIVNGAGYDTTTVWRQSFAVQPNTTYYFSAWAMSLNRVSPYAQLKFTINDSLFGTTAVLAPGANTTAGPFNWVRFFGTWNSNTSTFITISIVDLQTAAGGNDFGLDDISFGTLSPLPFSATPSGTACEGQTLVLNSNVVGGSSPYFYSWTGPNGFTSQAKDPVIPNATTNHSGTYTLNVTDGYSCPVTTSTIVTVGQSAVVYAGPAQGVCAGGTITLAGTRSGAATSSTWSAPSGIFSNVNSLTSTYTPSITNGTVTLTLTSNDPAGICPASVSNVVITVSNTTANAGPDQIVCAGGSINLAGSIGGSATSATWSAPSGTFSNINSLTSTYTPSITSGSVTLTLTTNDPPGICGPSTSTVIITVKPSPTVVSLTPPVVCIGSSTVLTANNSGGILDQTFSGASGTINQSIPDENTTGRTSTIMLTGAGTLTLAATDNIQVSLNITHNNDDELDIFLVDPSGTRAILLSSDNGGSGNNYTNTVFNTNANNIIGSAGNNTAPFSNTYRPEGNISTAPDRTGAANGGNYNAVIPASSLLGAAINGGWRLKVFDDNDNGIGTFISWSLSITKSGIGNYTTTFSGPGTIGAVTYSGANNTTASTTVTAPVGNNTYTMVTTDAGGCTGTTNVIVTVNPLAIAEAGGPNQVCRSANPSPITLSGAFVGGAATTGAWIILSGSGTLSSTLQTANPEIVTFTPAVNYNGTVTLQLTTNDPTGPCGSINDTRTIIVNALPVVNAGTYAAVCISAGSVSLSGSPAGGVFSGPGVVGNSFVPATAGAGTHSITYTYTNANGCTNSASANITVNPLPVVSAGTYAPVCINNGNVLLAGSPSGGIFGGPGVSGNTFNPVAAGTGTHNITYSFTNGNGCSAIATTSIVVKNRVSTQFNAVACISYTLPWGTQATTSGNYVHTYTAVNGCDSVVTAHITINNAAATQFTAANCLSYTLPWGTTVTTSGNYVHTYQTIKGCDSVVTAHITINNAAATQFTAASCVSYTLPWGTVVTTSGDYVHTYQTVKGCDSVVTAHITINSAAATHFTGIGCVSYTLPWGTTVTTSGNYFHTYQTVNGCDSIVTAHITINNAAASQLTAANCLSYTLPWGTMVTTSGDYVHTYQTINGCDSVVTAHITINNAAATQFTAASCLSYTLPWGTTVTTSGDYLHTYQTINGCDSVVTIHVTINNAAATQFTAANCLSYTLPWGTTVSASGDYVHTYQTINGCDSVVTAHIMINNAAATQFTAASCLSYTLPWGTTVTTSGDYLHTYQTINGCDSVVTIHVTINNAAATQFTAANCLSYTLPWGTTVSASGDYVHTYQTINGCDSVVTAHITINNAIATQFTVANCSSYTMPWGTTVTTSGDYVHTYQTVSGCDSVVTAHITINNAAATQFTAANCLSYTLPWGAAVTTSGDYVHTYQTINGCDSVVTAHITINNAVATQFTAANCLSYTLPWGTTVTTSGDHVHTYQTINGCDSVVTAHITINNAVATQFTAANCLSYTLPWGTTVTTSGDHVHTYQTINGCDSVVTAHITINNAAASQLTAANCLSYTLPWGTTVTTSGDYVHTYQTVNGCDSVVTAHITINNAAATQFTAANCLSYTLPWGATVTTSGDYVHTYQTINGCDSVVTAHITINNAAASQLTAANCLSYILPWGTIATTSGDYVHTYQTINGCDSVVTAHITINNAAATQFTAANCSSYTLPWGATVTTSGDYVHTYQTINGCDSVVTAHIIISPIVATDFVQATCLSYTLPWGPIVTTNGDYVHTYQTVNGCDSVVTAHITINNAAATQFTAANCLSYTLPWGTTVTTSGDYVHTYQTINGCDSVVTAHITINNAAATQFTAANCLSYTLPWGTIVTTSGDYIHTYQTINGCDSVVTAHITINTAAATQFTAANCLSYTLPWGTIVTTSGDYIHTYQTINGCDSVVTAHITINTAAATQFTAANCLSYTLPWGTTVTTSGDNVHTYQTINGCDSVVTAHITINTAAATQFTAANCLSYTLPWGTAVTTSGDYVHTYQTVNGCDSVVTAHITINNAAATQFTTVNCLSYTLPWGTTVTTSGDYIHTYQTINGCDSVVTAHITINTAAATQFTAANCLSYTLPWGTTVTTSGDNVHTYQTINGCDSVVTAHITINTAAATQFTAANCLSYTLPWGMAVTTSGDYVHTYQTVNGCDSVVTAHITINNAAATQFTTVNCLSYTLPWGTTVTTSGDYIHTYQTINGCDSVVTAHITINNAAATQFTAANCLSYTLPWGTIVTTSGDYIHTYQTINGCDSVVTAHITINTAAATQFTAANCSSYTLPWGMTVTTSGDYVHTYQTVNGCDSVVTAHIIISPIVATDYTHSACLSYTLPWGTTVTTSGDYVHTYQTVNGCDSVVTAHITINNAAATQFTAANCLSYTLPWGTTVTTSGDYVHTYQTVNGCDSVVTAHITINTAAATQFTAANCLSYTLPWGTTVTTSGDYVHTYQTANGCDSVVTAHITINTAAATQFTAASCLSYTLPWGTTVTTSGDYVHTYQTVDGCDSVVTAHITINNVAVTQFTAASCLSYTLPWGTTVTTSGDYVHTYQTVDGCDSVVTAHITINTAAATQFTAASCLSYTLPWGTTVTTSGDYVHTYQTTKGCDSLVTAHITINNAAATQFTAANCSSYTLPWGTTVTTSGDYIHTYQTVNGCDSVVTAHIIISPIVATDFVQAACLSYTLPWGTTVTTSGDYVHTYQTINGCDSVVTAHITINNAVATQFTAVNCSSYTLPWGTIVVTSGDYVHTYQTVNGCDSVVTAHITINNATATQFTAANCLSYTLPWGATVTTSGDYAHTYQTINGCDSIVTAHITINNAVATEFTASNCSSYTLPWGGMVTASGDFVHTYQTINGCDSVVTAHIIISPTVASEFTQAACLSYTLPWGNTVTTSGNYSHIYQTINGCDSLVTAHITINSATATQFTAANCLSYTLPWGTTVTTSGDYVHTYQTIYGCDSIVTAHITINNAAATQFTAANCLSYTLPWGTTVTTSGDYVHTYQTINGCDSVVTAHITINTAAATQFTAANCSSYTLPWGTTVTTSGDYIHTYQTVNGCDSVVTAHIIISPIVATDFVQAACLSYTLPWGTTVTTSGDYVHTYQTINGCDSVVTARITINNVTVTQFTVASCLSYTLPWGPTVTTSGDYVHTYQTVNGCDSIVTAHITINNAAASQFAAASCLSYMLPWGTTVTTSGDYVHTYQTINGCDSVVTAHITINNAVATQFTAGNCSSYTLPWGTTVTTSGDYVHTYQTVNGCDSVVTAHIIISPTVATDFEQAACLNYTLPWGATVTTSGDYVHTYQTVNGCDSVVTAHIAINNAAASQFTAANCLSYTLPWGTTATTSGDHVHTYQTVNGCDSVVTAHITINNAAATQFTAANCSSYTLPWGTTVTTSGDYVHTYQTINGCDSVVTAHIIISPIVATDFVQAACLSYSLPWGPIVTTSGDYAHTYQTVNGCDSVVTAHITINNAAATQFTDANCSSYTLPWGATVTTSGDYVHTYQTINGCDSVVTAHITINNAAATQFTAANCLSYTLPWGTAVTTSGDFAHTYQTINGCDSVVTAHITINNAAATQFTAASCLSYTLPWGTTVTTSGDYIHTYQTINSCDSVVTAHITINNAVATQFTAATCLSYTLPWGTTVTTSGDYVHTYQTINGCDSVVTAHITINTAVESTRTITICEAALPYNWNNHTITASGDYVANLVSVNGCDSTATLHLIANPAVTGQETVAICETALPFNWNNQAITAAGDYTATLVSAAGCDSIATLHLIINPVVTGEQIITICEASLPYNWNAQTLTSAGDYTATLVSAAGCDSIATLNLIINPVVTGEQTITICEAALPYNWNNQTLTAAGDYTATLVGVNGCDSIATLHLIINPVVTGEETITICEAALPYNWNNQTLTAPSDYTATLVSAAGCDSIATLHLVINPIVTGDQTITICEAALPYTWNAQTIKAAGDYTATLVGVNGCDSIATLHLIVNPVVTGEETITICEAALPYSWNNQTVTAAGDYTATLISAASCDSIATLHLIINPVVTGEETITICEAALPYSWNNQAITAAGDYTATLLSVNGCDSIATLHLITNPAVTGEETITICETALPYNWNNQSITVAGNYTANLVSINGCDSIAILHLIANPAVTGQETMAICETALPYSWNNQTLTAAGDYTATLISAAGCDSIATLHLIINPVVTGEQTITICEAALPYSWNNQAITAAGDYTAILVSATGCDSIATLHLTINPAVTGEETITICEAALPYNWNNQTLTAAGDYTATLVSAAGCDSIATLHLIINPVVTSEETITICEAALPYNWNNQAITAAGDYTATLLSAAGCDSIATLHLIINPVVTGEETITICEAALPYNWNNQAITAAGDYTATLLSAAGCDSIATLHLIINPVVTGEETITICEAALPYNWNNQAITAAGDYTATLLSAAGCDSIAILHLIINPVVTGEESITICEAALPYNWNNQSITAAGDYTATLVSVNGCDSIVTLHLNINPIVTGEETITICESALPYNWNNQTLTAAGDYTATLVSINGCDSIATLHLIVNPVVTGEQTITICEAALPYNWNAQTLTAAGDYTATLVGVNGCDSIAILHLIVNPVVTGEETITICEAALPYSWNNQTITAAGDYTATLVSINGCDSIATLHLIVNPVVTGEQTITICEAALPYNWNNQTLTAAGDYTATLVGVNGCDSITTLHLIVNPVVTGEETITICGAALPYNWNNQTLTAPGDYTATLLSAAGCDSIATLHLIINPVVTGEETITICEAALPYNWTNQVITAAGDYTTTLVSVNGCDSIAILHLIINPAVTGEETIAICEAALPYSWNNQAITTAGDYTATLVSAAGCDSIATLHLIINPVVTGEQTITVCEGALPYSWNNQVIIAAGDYTATLVSAANCDSIVTLHLIINPVVTGEESITICEAALPYNWNNQSITAAGDYTATLVSVNGCDSIVTLHLNINPIVTGEETITICESALPYNWNNQTLTAAGDYTTTLVSVNGCDSIATLHLIINPVVTREETITICEAALPYNWNNQTLTAAGDYTATLISINGCDSIAILHLIANPVVTGEGTITICEAALPYSWNNQTLMAAGDYTAALLSAAGCDSIATLHLIVNPVVTGEQTITICEAALPYNWNNQTLTAAGDYTATLVGVNGCDSITTLHLIVNPVVTGEQTITICEAALPYNWNNQTLMAAGDYTATLVGVNGCDSITTLHLIINPVVTGEETITICEAALPYNWNNQTLTAAGNYTATLVGVNGCDSIATLLLIVTPQPPAPIVTISPAICSSLNGIITITSPAPANGITYSINGIDFQASNIFPALAPGNYIITVKDMNSCNSSANVTVGQVSTNFTINQTITNNTCTAMNGTINLTAAGSQAHYTYAWSGPANFSSTTEDLDGLAAGDYTVIVTDANGCTQTKTIKVSQSITTITLNQVVENTICTADNGSINLTVNNGSAPYSYSWIGPNNFSSVTEDHHGLTAGEYSVLVTDVNGCTAETSIKVTQVTNTITLNKEVINATCNAKNGSIDLVVNGGNPPYTYTWSGPSGFTATTEDLSNLAPGSYDVTVTDKNGCTSAITALVGRTEMTPVVVTHDIYSCSTADLTAATVTEGSEPGLLFTYWYDVTATNPVADPASVLNGTYYIKGTNTAGCYLIKPINVTIEATPLFITANPARKCESEAVDLTDPAITAGSDPRLTFTYWNDAATTNPLVNPKSVSESGTYYIKATAVGGCTFVKSVEVVVTLVRGNKSVRYPTVTVAPNTSVQLNARQPGLVNNYTWNPPVGLNAYNRKDPVFRYDKSTEYTVRIEYDNQCPVIDTVLVLMRPADGNCVSDVFVPKAWSPNNDGHNDKLYPIPVCIKELKYFRVFNRWGQLVFQTNILCQGWDGIFNGQPQVMDTYTWTFEATGEDGKYYKRAGNSVLLR